MDGKIEIRPAIDADVPLILELIRALAEYEKLAHAVEATEEKLRRTLFGSRPCAEVLIALKDGQPAGYASYFHPYSTFLAKAGLYLEDVFVLPTMRGQGIGKRLLKTVATIALDRDCGRIEWLVLNWNESAMAFYEKIGALPMDEWKMCRMTETAISKLAGEKFD